MMEVYDTTARLLEQALDALALRQRATAANLVNATTPGYRARRVSDEAELRAALGSDAPLVLRTTHPAHLDRPSPTEVRPNVSVAHPAFARNDLNTVRVEEEIVGLVQTTMRYTAMARLLAGRLGVVRAAITEGRF